MTVCALCAAECSTRFGFRVAEMRYVVCERCSLLPRDVTMGMLARRQPKAPRVSKHCPAHKGRWAIGGPRCELVAGCRLARTHGGFCYLGESTGD